jgi:hypothetical protein
MRLKTVMFGVLSARIYGVRGACDDVYRRSQRIEGIFSIQEERIAIGDDKSLWDETEPATSIRKDLERVLEESSRGEGDAESIGMFGVYEDESINSNRIIPGSK